MSDVDAHGKDGARRCVTCHKDYPSGHPGIRSLAQFEAWCVCEECVESFQKRKPADPTAKS